MHTALYVPIINDYSDPQRLIQLAHAAESAGYEGFFIWDHLASDPGGRLAMVDATVMLGALAQATHRLRLGAMVTPLARRRPWKFAKELATLDHLSAGRIVAGVGLGEPAQVEFAAFGEDATSVGRARRLDEGLALLDPLLRGESVTHQGQHYQLQQVRLAPRCVQTPRVPIWVAAALPAQAGLRRAARWDGCFPIKIPSAITEGTIATADWSQWWLTSEEFAGAASVLQKLRAANEKLSTPFDLIASGRTIYNPREQAATLEAFQAAGASWWFEWVDDAPGMFDETLAAVRAGAPRVNQSAEPAPTSLRAAIQRIRGDIENAALVDRAELTELHRLAVEIEEQLNLRPPASESNALRGLREQLERLEVAHPRATGILNDLLMTLSNLGI
jgi:Luciferase-like monooxygenase/Domain of unknown function (DUF4404)